MKSTILLVKYLLPKATQSNASFLTMTAGWVQFPTEILVGNSGYLVSKLALAKTIEFLSKENPNVFFASIHPGTVDTNIFRGSGATPESMPMDTRMFTCRSNSSRLTLTYRIAQLVAGFILWISKPEAKFLNGRTVWANWDVTELKGMQEDISSSNELTIGLVGWPFTAQKST